MGEGARPDVIGEAAGDVLVECGEAVGDGTFGPDSEVHDGAVHGE